MNSLKYYIDSYLIHHKFFLKESKSFLGGKYSFKDKLYFPLAYIKFMWYSFKNTNT